MKLKYLAFSEQGEVLARRIAETLGGEVTRSRKSYGSYAWTADNFGCADGLVYVGASGIAVRSIAPHLVDKAHDPAVIVIDERGNFVISLVSGHLGGANDLARRIAALIDGLPVITTATDVNGVFAVDAWARVQGCHLLEKERILGIATRLLAGKSVRFASPFTVGGEVPDGIQVIPAGEPADICLDVFVQGKALHIVPPVVTLGIGCRRGTVQEKIEAAWRAMCTETGLAEEAVVGVASIDLKKDEKGLQAFCREHGWPFRTYSAGELKEVPGEFTASELVKKVTGVDNVCERSALAEAGGQLLLRKFAKDGVTIAAAARAFTPDWRDKDD